MSFLSFKTRSRDLKKSCRKESKYLKTIQWILLTFLQTKRHHLFRKTQHLLKDALLFIILKLERLWTKTKIKRINLKSRTTFELKQYLENWESRKSMLRRMMMMMKMRMKLKKEMIEIWKFNSRSDMKQLELIKATQMMIISSKETQIERKTQIFDQTWTLQIVTLLTAKRKFESQDLKLEAILEFKISMYPAKRDQLNFYLLLMKLRKILFEETSAQRILKSEVLVSRQVQEDILLGLRLKLQKKVLLYQLHQNQKHEINFSKVLSFEIRKILSKS